MFGFVNTEEKEKLKDNNDIHIDRRKKERTFIIYFGLLAFAILNLALYLLTKSY